MSISTTIKSIQDIMRKDVGVDGDAQRIGQLVWMLFLKMFDANEELYEWEAGYRSPIPEPLRWRNWAADAEGITGDDLLDFVNNQLFPTLKNLQPAPHDQRGFVIRSVFEDAYNYMKSGQLMRQVINKISAGIDFNKAQDRHLFGDLYEQILRDLQNAGNAGEYYTPRPVTQFIVDRVNPQLGEKILDPACGTGGFLTCTIEHVRKQYVKTVEDERQLQASIHGVEKKPLPHLLCTTNMILHGIDVPDQGPPRQHPGPPAARLRPEGPRRCHRHQPALRRHGRRRHREQLPRHLPHPRNRRPVPRADHAPAQRRWPRRRGAARRHPVRRRHQDPHQGTTADRVQSAHRRPPAQWRVQPLHRHQDQPAVLHQRARRPRKSGSTSTPIRRA